MKHLNQRSEAIIETNTTRVDWKTKTKEGEVVPHKEVVNFVKIYIPNYDARGKVASHNAVFIYREDFIDIYNQINEIESRVFDEAYYSDVPF